MNVKMKIIFLQATIEAELRINRNIESNVKRNFCKRGTTDDTINIERGQGTTYGRLFLGLAKLCSAFFSSKAT